MVLSPRFFVTSFVAAALIAVVTAIPTAIIDNPWFTRMTPVYADQYAFWIGSSVLAGALLATYVAGPKMDAGVGGGVGGGLLGYLAIGCPICNKIVVGLLGVAGAMDYFAPVQPLLGALGSLALLAALVYRVRSLRRQSCPVRLTA